MDSNNVYESNEDTYLLIDALKKNKDLFIDKIILEIGCGGGAVIASVLDNCSNSLLIGTDINLEALEVSRNRANSCEFWLADLLNGIIHENIDIVIFNPPYVETEHAKHSGLAASYSGGLLGRCIIDRFVRDLSIPVVFLLVTRKNAPHSVVLNLEENGYNVEVVNSRQALGETLVVLKATQVK